MQSCKDGKEMKWHMWRLHNCEEYFYPMKECCDTSKAYELEKEPMNICWEPMNNVL